MKVTTTCEKEFIVNCITQKEKRIDGRSLLDGRTLQIIFGQEWGCCFVNQGNTRVLAQVTAEVTEPKIVSPTEGALHINLELSSMSGPEVNTSRNSNEAVESQRSLERCIRDSKCIDLESLCIVAGSKVWTIRVDIHALNDDGNLLECTSIAAVAALAHFKRPDVTVVGTEVTVHSLDDREPVPLNLHHMPISVCMALYDQGSHILVDPTEIEERIADGCYIIGMNAHQEICSVHRRGVLLLQEEVIQRCEDIAVRRAQTVTQVIRKALDDDAYKRATKALIGFVHMLQTGTILSERYTMHDFDLNSIKAIATVPEASSNAEVVTVDEASAPRTSVVEVSAAKEKALKILKASETAVFEGGSSKWGVEEEEKEDSSSEDESEEDDKKKPPKSSMPVKEEAVVSEEEETSYMESDQVDFKAPTSRGWYTADPFR